jgi:hypothetical protein
MFHDALLWVPFSKAARESYAGSARATMQNQTIQARSPRKDSPLPLNSPLPKDQHAGGKVYHFATRCPILHRQTIKPVRIDGAHICRLGIAFKSEQGKARRE